MDLKLLENLRAYRNVRIPAASMRIVKHLIFKKAVAFVHSGRRVIQAAYISESTDYDCYEKIPINTLKLVSLRIYGTRVFSIDPAHPDLETSQQQTMLILRDRQPAATQVSFLAKPTYEVYVKVSDFMNQFVEGLYQVQIIDTNEAPILGRNISIVSLTLDNKRYVQENSRKAPPSAIHSLYLIQTQCKIINLVSFSRIMKMNFT